MNAEKGDFIMRLNKLLSPGKIGTLELKNRFVVPPMGTNFATYEGVVTDDIGDAAAPAPANKATEAALDAVLKLG